MGNCEMPTNKEQIKRSNEVDNNSVLVNNAYKNRCFAIKQLRNIHHHRYMNLIYTFTSNKIKLRNIHVTKPKC